MILFFILGLYIAYIQVVKSDEFIRNAGNPRNFERIMHRGRIYARDGSVLAVSKKGAEPADRFYPKKEFSEPVMGYLSLRYGKDSLEKKLDKYLRAKDLSNDLIGYILRRQPRGEDVYLTIDADIQLEATKALEGKKGAIVVMNPQNGEILALASSPSFKPSDIDSRWKILTSDRESPFLLRPVNGSYPPGSVFKIFTLSACLNEGVVDENTAFYCSGDFPMKYPQGTYHIREAHGTAHGTVTSVDALVYSCNVAFAQMGLKLGKEKFIEYAREFGLLEKPDFILSEVENIIPREEELTPTQLAQCSFGQGELSLTPLSVALMTSAFANNGKICVPRIVKSRVDEKGETVYKVEHKVWKTPITANTAHKVRDAMIQVVERGTARRARIEGVKVAGKTGSAENPMGDTHAYFTCFAPADNPKILITVIIENGGYGGKVSAPIALNILKKSLGKK